MRQKRPPDKDKLYWELDLDDLFRRLKEGMGRLFIPKGKKRKPNPMEDRRVFVGYPPEYSMVSFVIGAVITGVMGLLSLLYATWIPLICAGMLWIPLGLLCLLGGYEIRYDGEGFTTYLFDRELRQYAWSEVTSVRESSEMVFVNGKWLLLDSGMKNHCEFFRRARAACKPHRKSTSISEKKPKSRLK